MHLKAKRTRYATIGLDLYGAKKKTPIEWSQWSLKFHLKSSVRTFVDTLLDGNDRYGLSTTGAFAHYERRCELVCNQNRSIGECFYVRAIHPSIHRSIHSFIHSSIWTKVFCTVEQEHPRDFFLTADWVFRLFVQYRTGSVHLLVLGFRFVCNNGDGRNTRNATNAHTMWRAFSMVTTTSIARGYLSIYLSWCPIQYNTIQYHSIGWNERNEATTLQATTKASKIKSDDFMDGRHTIQYNTIQTTDQRQSKTKGFSFQQFL